MRYAILGMAALGAACMATPAAAVGITGFTLTASGTLTTTYVGCDPFAGLDPCPYTPIPAGVPLVADFTIHFANPLAQTGTHQFRIDLVDWQQLQPGERRNQGYVDTVDRYESWDGWYSYDSFAFGGSTLRGTITDGQLTAFNLLSTLKVLPADTACQVTDFHANGGVFNFQFAQFCFFKVLDLRGRGSYAATMHYEPGPAPAVPEPATWAMLIAGFGLTGATLRRRRTLAA